MNPTILKQYIEENGYEPQSYSGRGMYGKQCISFTTDDKMLPALANIIECCSDVEEAAETCTSSPHR